MKITQLLEYQQIDKEMQLLLKELNSSPESKAYVITKQTVTDVKDDLMKLDRTAGELIANFENDLKKLDNSQEQLKELKKAVKDANDIQMIDYFQRKLDELVNECNFLSREINNIKQNISIIKNKTNEAMKKGKDAQQSHNDAKIALDKFKADNNPRVEEIKDRLNNLERIINDSNIIDRYKQAKANGKFPVFVKCEGATCYGCGMNIASNLEQKLKSSDELLDCPNCGRIMYYPNKE